MHPNDVDEPMLQEDKRTRFILHPIQYQDVYDAATEAEQSLWGTDEVDLSKDLMDLQKLTPDTQYFILHVLAFFAASDGIVNENLVERLMSKIQWAEVRLMYGIQVGIESIHAKMYSILLDTYVSDTKQKYELFSAITHMPCIREKAEWALNYTKNPNTSLAQLLVAFAAVEGIFFSASFASIYFIKTLGLMPGLTHSNELISRDEGMHTEFAILLYTRYIKHRLSDAEARAIVRDAIEVEEAFVCNILPKPLMRMNSDRMCQYVRFVGNRLSISLGHGSLYEEAPINPFDFMDNICTEGKTNFFERRVSEYSKPRMNTIQVDGSSGLGLDDKELDF